jgi:hypothetical protein
MRLQRIVAWFNEFNKHTGVDHEAPVLAHKVVD